MPTAVKASVSRKEHTGRQFPVVRLLLYYAALLLVGGLLVAFVPGFRDALVAPITPAPPGQVDELLTGGHPVIPGPPGPWPGVFGRGALTFVAMIWALATVMPVAWALMRTRRLRYDPSLVHTLLVLPIVVAGVVLIVKNSLALAFALAGIVAGVRFRQKLEQPEEAVYVLLALGIGLAAGVQALDVALVLSMTFTLVVMTLWRYDIGDIYATGRGAQLVTGNVRLLPSDRANPEKLLAQHAELAKDMQPDGILLVRTEDPDGARVSIETIASRFASEWRVADPVLDRNGLASLAVLLRMKDDEDPADLIGELETRWSDLIMAAKYVPFGRAEKAD
jgi:hypothetical protein